MIRIESPHKHQLANLILISSPHPGKVHTRMHGASFVVASRPLQNDLAGLSVAINQRGHATPPQIMDRHDKL